MTTIWTSSLGVAVRRGTVAIFAAVVGDLHVAMARGTEPDLIGRVPNHFSVITDQYHGLKVQIGHQQIPARVMARR